jgi:hypothetical protein
VVGKEGMTGGPSQEKKKRKQNQFEFEIDTSNLLKLDLIQIGCSLAPKI